MSMGIAFQKNKVNRLLQQNGTDFVFKRKKKNLYNEPIDGEYEQELSMRGFFHATGTYASRVKDEGSTIKSLPNYSVLTMYEDGVQVIQDDEVEYEGKKYKVINSENVNSLNVCCDISLELIQDGE